ncbi:CHASE3 domain-containing protein [Roseomonas sp. ACRSG]|nr:CHASE3 domain-containing protein [Roseomonas sp. ACRSG]
MPRTMARKAKLLTVAATALLVGGVGGLTWFGFDNARETQLWVRHTYEVITTANQLGIAVRDAEIGQRGYLLTDRDDYLDSHRDALGRITRLQEELRRLTVDNPVQQDQLRALAPLLQQRLDSLAHAIQVRRDEGAEAARAIVQAGRGRQLTAAIESALAAVHAEEERLLELRKEAADRSQALTRWFALGGAVLAVALLALSARFLARAQAQLTESEATQRALAEQLRTALESISQGIGAFDAEGRLVRWNECFMTLLSLSRSMMREGTAYEAIAEQVGAATSGFMLETWDQIRHGRGGRSSDEPVVYERTRATDGRSFELRRTAMPGGGFVLTVTDITERVRAEATARGAQRLQAMGQLTGGIAHDFNNLLTVVLGNLELAKPKLEENSPVLPRIEQAIWGARRGATLTQQLLAFARKQPLAPVPINLSAMLPDMAELLRRTLGAHIEVRVVDAAGLWPAMADAVQVESALLNLALNARDAMPEGGRLTIELANKVLDEGYARQHTEVTPGDYVMLGVSDTGTGMPPEVLTRAFEPFFTTKEVGKGTGLGLAMVFGFAKQSGGHVKVYSEPGEGTTVRLYLPRAVGVNLAGIQRPGAPVELPRGSATVLVVEDETAVREVTTAILCDLGYQILEAADGAEALRVFEENGGRVDLLLCDVILPGGMKGHDVARKLNEVRQGLPVLFMSGYTENAIVHHGRLDDGVHFISKPFEREQLARKVAQVLNTPIQQLRTEQGRVVSLSPRQPRAPEA